MTYETSDISRDSFFIAGLVVVLHECFTHRQGHVVYVCTD